VSGWEEGACDCTPACLLGLTDCCQDYLIECSIGRNFRPFFFSFLFLHTFAAFILQFCISYPIDSLFKHPLYCKENPIYVILFGELHGLCPNFHIHVSVSDLYIPKIGPHISLQQNRQTDPGNI
jgi:hypothetical protein